MRRYNIPTLADGVAARGAITAEDVAVLQKNYFNGEEVWPHEARALFDLLQKRLPACEDWSAFIVEALASYVIDELEPRGSLDDKNGRFLAAMLRRDLPNCGADEMRLVQLVMDRTGKAPVALLHLALEVSQGAVMPSAEAPNAREDGRNIQEFSGAVEPLSQQAKSSAAA